MRLETTTNSHVSGDPKANFAFDAKAHGEPPLVVDVDGTLLRTDLLVESFIRLLMVRPFDALKAPYWLSVGKSNLKAQIADRVCVDIETLPLEPTVFSLVQREQARGRRVILASASERRYVEALAARIGLTEPVFATDQGCNLSGPRKRDALVAAFGEGGFDYIGDSRTDRPVWQAARRSYVMRSAFGDPTRGLGDRAPEMVARSRTTPRTVASALRIHQWVKNLLVFVPLIFGGAIADSGAVLKALLCFVAFCALASSTYLINDLLDVANDRRHPSKRHRPLASGGLHPVPAVGLALLGTLIGLGIGAAISWSVLFGLAGYLALTLAFSLRLKRVPIVDAVTLGGFYTWRLFVGVLAAGVTLSAWLMVFSLAFFLSLALAKRHAEITKMITTNRTELAGRGYRTCDAPFVMNMGIAAGMSSILIFILYLIDGAFRAAYFTAPTVLWVCPVILLLWISRVWMLAGRGELHEDPVEFAIKDPKSSILAAIAAAAVLMAMLA